MKVCLSLILSFIFSGVNTYTFSCSHSYCTQAEKIVVVHDSIKMFSPVPKELIVSKVVSDSDVIVIEKRCVVHSIYSEMELSELQKKSRSADEWAAFYDNYLFYNEDVSMFIYERALVVTESQKKYIRFIFDSGVSITVDRLKSAGKLFFFNPSSGLRQCDSFSFDRRKYTNF